MLELWKNNGQRQIFLSTIIDYMNKYIIENEFSWIENFDFITYALFHSLFLCLEN